MTVKSDDIEIMNKHFKRKCNVTETGYKRKLDTDEFLCSVDSSPNDASSGSAY